MQSVGDIAAVMVAALLLPPEVHAKAQTLKNNPTKLKELFLEYHMRDDLADRFVQMWCKEDNNATT